MDGYHIFIVEDDPWYAKILEYHLSLNPEYKISTFMSGKDCLDKLYIKPDLITLDLSLPDMSGSKIYDRIRDVDPRVPVIVISSQENIAVAVDLLKKGVNDYLVKDDNTKDLLWKSIIRIRETQSLQKEVEQLREELSHKFTFEKTIIGQSEALKKVFSLMEKATRTTINVSITGETGTGKELVAKAIHYNSDRQKKDFVAVNMGSIPTDLIESELFGHEKGAFTGAITRKIGKFEKANGGTIFLDEIAELDFNLQSKLLRILQEREVVRVGGNERVSLDVRLIVATHKDLAEEVKKGKFREDLFYCLLGLPIELPPLRNRGNDILILARYFADQFAKDNKLKTISIAPAAREKLLQYHYPGNIRELKAMIDLAAVMCNDSEILPDDIRFMSARHEDLNFLQPKSLRQHTCDIIQYYLDKNGGDVIATAKALEIGKSTIYKMIQDGEVAS